MRISLAISLVALGALLGGATLAQDAAPSPAPTPLADPVQADAPTDPFLRALGGTADAAPVADPVAPAPRATIDAMVGPSGRTVYGIGLADAGPQASPLAPDSEASPFADGTDHYLYVVQKGDSLVKVANKFHSTVDRLRAANPGVAVDRLAVGTQLRIPVQVAGVGSWLEQLPDAAGAPVAGGGVRWAPQVRGAQVQPDQVQYDPKAPVTWIEADRIEYDGLPGGRYTVTADGGVRIWNDPRLPGAVRWATPNDSGSVELRVTVESGRVQVWQGGRAIPDDRVEQEGNTFVIRDGEGRTLASIDIDPDGRVTIPSDWTFRGPAQWTTERLSRNVIGIRTGGLEPALARHLRLEEGHGILVTEVVPGHPAERAGLRGYDVIVAVDGKGPATLDFLKQILASKDTNSTVTLTVVRAGNTLEIRSGITTVSAPVGRTTALPEGAFALGSLGVDAAGVESAPSLIWRRGGAFGAIGADEFGIESLPDPRVRRGGMRGTVVDPEGRVIREAQVRPDAFSREGLVGREVAPDTITVIDALADPEAMEQQKTVQELRDQLPNDWQVRYRLAEERQRSADAQKRIDEMMEEIRRLEILIEKMRAESDSRSDPESGRVTLPIDCKVLSAKDGNAVLSVGRADGVQIGDEFTIYRGDQFVGKVRVITIADETAAAKVLFTSDTTSVQAADQASTRLSFDFSEPNER